MRNQYWVPLAIVLTSALDLEALDTVTYTNAAPHGANFDTSLVHIPCPAALTAANRTQ